MVTRADRKPIEKKSPWQRFLELLIPPWIQVVAALVCAGIVYLADLWVQPDQARLRAEKQSSQLVRNQLLDLEKRLPQEREQDLQARVRAVQGQTLDRDGELEALLQSMGGIVKKEGWKGKITPSAPIQLTSEVPSLFAYPVVVKACSAQLAHKSDHGGVVLGVADAQALRLAMEQVKTNVARHAPLPADFELLVKPMVKGLAEVLLGFKRDPDAGAIVMLAVGGMWAEVVRERSIRLAPVDEAQAMEMIAELRALSPLQGLRGQAPGDLAALAQAISRFSQAAVLAVGDGVIEAEVNPLMVLPQGQGVCAVDALVLARAAPEHG